ncbi:hypothetical protein CFB46_20455 [Burkholderia sp. HI2761]|uniref:NPCBM/NEW2 domain-containing protein n=1 Tax=unclassified Burkholderia TaxID=2613784 RepID=UPI000B7A8106|nr:MULTISPECIES: NPCBM/NEW2 domain-containing protein [unclassified Burkholderia]OXJ23282.1 hypothetical protein CFB46_20455 [Burkholderia sp. HI2761]
MGYSTKLFTITISIAAATGLAGCGGDADHPPSSSITGSNITNTAGSSPATSSITTSPPGGASSPDGASTTTASGASGVGFNLSPLGWSSWNNFGQNVSETNIKSIADKMVSNGMLKAGYQYVNIDDGWMQGRDSNGNIQVNPNTFPDGMKALADYIHAKGLKLGIYSTNYSVTCVGRGRRGAPTYVGSLGHEAQDAATFAAWGIDFLKFDNCDGPADSFDRMRAALDSIAQNGGKKIYLNIHYVTRPDSFLQTPDSWAATSIGDSARIASDISANWGSVKHNIDDARTIAPAYNLPGFFGDLDSLEIGNGGLTADEAQTHMSIWSIMSAPLIAGNDLSVDNGALSYLLNSEVIAIDQDPLHFGASEIGLMAGTQSSIHVLAKPLTKTGSRAVALLNEGNTPANITVNFQDLGLAGGTASVRDVWAHQDLGQFTSSYTAQNVRAHATVLVTIQGKEPVLSNTVQLDKVHWAYAVFNRIGSSPYTSNILVDHAPPASNAQINAPSNPADSVMTAGWLGTPSPSGTMSIAGIPYVQGFGILGAPTQIAYRLDQKCSTFSASVGIDDNAYVAAAVSFQVWGDGNKLYDSGIMQKGTAANKIKIDVSKVSMLRLIVLGQAGGQLDDLIGRSGGQSGFDMADWGFPQLQCPAS